MDPYHVAIKRRKVAVKSGADLSCSDWNDGVGE